MKADCLMNGISSLIKETPEGYFFLYTMWEHRKVGSLEPGTWPSPEPDYAGTLIIYFQLPEYENTFVVYELPRLWYFVTAAGIE